MIGFFVLLVLLMVLIAVLVPALQGGWGGRRVVYDRRSDVIVDDPDVVDVPEVVDVVADEPLRPIARRRMVRRTRRY